MWCVTADAIESCFAATMRTLDRGASTLIARYVEVADAVARDEKISIVDSWPDEERMAYDLLEWEKFSRLRGYTDAEIAQFGELNQLAAAVDERFGSGAAAQLHAMLIRHTGPNLRKPDHSASESPQSATPIESQHRRILLVCHKNLPLHHFRYLASRARFHAHEPGPSDLWEKMNYGRNLYAVINEQDTPIGIIYMIGDKGTSADIGWWLDPMYRGNGYIGETIDGCANYLVSRGTTKRLRIEIRDHKYSRSEALVKRFEREFYTALIQRIGSSA
jgi:hypothetical protein